MKAHRRNVDQLEIALGSLGFRIAHVHQVDGLMRIEFREEGLDALPEALEMLAFANLPIRFAEPDYVYFSQILPNDPDFDRLWGLRNTGQTGGLAGADIQAVDAWATTTGDSEIVVGVIDSGIDYTHPDLSTNIWSNPLESVNGQDDSGNGYIDDVRGWNFYDNNANPYDDNLHGTHVAGTIGAVGDNGIGVTGVAWNVSMIPLKFLSGSGSGFASDAILAIDYATQAGAKLTCNSWGGGGYSQALKDAIVRAADADVLFVAAAGNSGMDADLWPMYPAAYDVPNIISVAASDHSDNPARFSNSATSGSRTPGSLRSACPQTQPPPHPSGRWFAPCRLSPDSNP